MNCLTFVSQISLDYRKYTKKNENMVYFNENYLNIDDN